MAKVYDTTFRVLLNGKAYAMSRSIVDVLIKEAKKKYKAEKKNAIVAVEKNNSVEFRRDEYKNYREFSKQLKEYEANGFKVHYNLVGFKRGLTP